MGTESRAESARWEVGEEAAGVVDDAGADAEEEAVGAGEAVVDACAGE